MKQNLSSLEAAQPFPETLFRPSGHAKDEIKLFKNNNVSLTINNHNIFSVITIRDILNFGEGSSRLHTLWISTTHVLSLWFAISAGFFFLHIYNIFFSSHNPS